jgi:Fe2+ transport system protein B
MYIRRSGGNSYFNHYVCSGYAKQIKDCTAHYIREDVLKQIVLEKIQKLFAKASSDLEGFKNAIGKQVLKNNTKRLTQIEKEVEADTQSVEQMQQTLTAIYMDKLKGNITQEVFGLLSAENAKQQRTLTEKIDLLKEEAVEIKKSSSEVNRFFSIIAKYDSIDTLTYDILHELVERVEVHEGVGKTRKSKTYQVDVFFKGIGLIGLDELD